MPESDEGILSDLGDVICLICWNWVCSLSSSVHPSMLVSSITRALGAGKCNGGDMLYLCRWYFSPKCCPRHFRCQMFLEASYCKGYPDAWQWTGGASNLLVLWRLYVSIVFLVEILLILDILHGICCFSFGFANGWGPPTAICCCQSQRSCGAFGRACQTHRRSWAAPKIRPPKKSRKKKKTSLSLITVKLLGEPNKHGIVFPLGFVVSGYGDRYIGYIFVAGANTLPGGLPCILEPWQHGDSFQWFRVIFLCFLWKNHWMIWWNPRQVLNPEYEIRLLDEITVHEFLTPEDGGRKITGWPDDLCCSKAPLALGPTSDFWFSHDSAQVGCHQMLVQVETCSLAVPVCISLLLPCSFVMGSHKQRDQA